MAPLQLFAEAGALLMALSAVAVLLLRTSAAKTSPPANHLADLIDNLLPQTQCGQCGHPGCRPYAEAIARGEPFNRCPPGRDHTVRALAQLLGQPLLPLDGELKPKTVAYIREAECIGCTKCIQACPVDAILGASKLMHTVIADECTGCDLCVEPCPVDCIEMRSLPGDHHVITAPQAQHYKNRFIAHNIRLQQQQAEQEARRLARKNTARPTTAETACNIIAAASADEIAPAETQIEAAAETSIAAATTSKQEQIQAAIARAKAKKTAAKNSGAPQ